MEIVLFRARTRAGHDAEEYGRLFGQLLGRVQEMPGFLDIVGYGGEDGSEDGSELAVVRFESPDDVARWRDHPEHVEGRRRGREEFYDDYQITVATSTRQYGWIRPEVAHADA